MERNATLDYRSGRVREGEEEEEKGDCQAGQTFVNMIQRIQIHLERERAIKWEVGSKNGSKNVEIK